MLLGASFNPKQETLKESGIAETVLQEKVKISKVNLINQPRTQMAIAI